MPLDIPMPWLRTVSPIESLSSGAGAGASAARLEQEATNESARLGMEARRLNQQAAFESARLSQAAEQSQMEFQARQKLAEQNQLREQQRLNIENAYKTAALGIAKGRLEETQRVADEKARAAALTFQREQGFARAVAGGMPVMEAYQRFPVSSALLNATERMQSKKDQLEKPIHVGESIVERDPTTGEWKQTYTAPASQKPIKVGNTLVRPKEGGGVEVMYTAPTKTTSDPLLGAAVGVRGEGKSPEATSKFGHPKVGEIRFGHRFKGGDPNDENNWEVVKEGE